jgi:predicted MFS family arabinose efflux permease
VFGGTLADAVGPETPLLAAAGLGLVVLAGLVAGDPGRSVIHERQTAPELLSLVRGEQAVLAAALLMLVAGLAESVVNVLAPLQLDENGLSASAVGTVLAVGAGVFVAVSSVVVRLAHRSAGIRWGAGSALVLGLALVPLVVSEATPPVVTGTIGRVAVLGVVYTIAFPLAAAGAYRAGIGRGSVNAVLMASSGVANTIGPLAGGGLADGVGERMAYVAVAGACILAGAWMLSVARQPAPAGERACA